MSMKALLAERSPRFVRRGYRGVRSWYTILRSGNLRFLTFSAPGHFYSPIPDMHQIYRDTASSPDRAPDPVLDVDLNVEAQLALVARFAAHYAELPFPEQASPGCRYHMNNQWFSFGDSIALYSMMRTFEPKRIIEVGSGFSSAAMLEVDERFLGGRTDFTFIDPYPQRLTGLLREADRQRCTILAQRVQDVDLNVFAALAAGDILFIDSSHVAKADSDVLHLMFRVLPRLAEGVHVHIHDIMWPFEYPLNWHAQGRAWNEAYLLRAFLQNNSTFEITYFNSYLECEHADVLRAALPSSLKAPSSPNTRGNSSIWLRKTAGPAA